MIGELRMNPATGRLAERIPEEFVRDDYRWFTYWWAAEIGLTVKVMRDAEVADWYLVALSDEGDELAEEIDRKISGDQP